MGYYCTVPQCTSLAGKTKNVKFHRFPRDVTMADKWNVILKRGKPYTKYSKVCSLHFTQADYNVTAMGQWKTLSKDAVPSQNLPKLNPDGSVMVIRKSRTVKYKHDVRPHHCPKSTPDASPVDKSEVWPIITVTASNNLSSMPDKQIEDVSVSNIYMHNNVTAVANTSSISETAKPKTIKQDAFMQTDPQPEDEADGHNLKEIPKDGSYNPDIKEPFSGRDDENFDDNVSSFDSETKDYTKDNEQFSPRNDYQSVSYQSNTPDHDNFQKTLSNDYNKVSNLNKSEVEVPQIDSVYIPCEPFKSQEYEKCESFENDSEYNYDKEDLLEKNDTYERTDPFQFQNGYVGNSVDVLRSQQHNLQMLQEQHRISENENFFNENHIKQEMDVGNEDDYISYNRPMSKENTVNYLQQDSNVYSQQRIMLTQIQQDDIVKNDFFEVPIDRIKTEPDMNQACEGVMQQENQYFQTNPGTTVYYEQQQQPMFTRQPGPELLIAKQNALAAHTQLWQNTMKRPFFYSESSHFNGAHLVHARYEFQDLTRILNQ